jgi:hypothetical protein
MNRRTFTLTLLGGIAAPVVARAHGDWDWIRQGFPDYRSQYSPPDLPYNCCGEHDIEALTLERWHQDGSDYVIDDRWRFPVAKAYPSERAYAVISWKLGAWAPESDSGRVKVPNVPGKIYNGRFIEGIHCFFFAPGGA